MMDEGKEVSVLKSIINEVRDYKSVKRDMIIYLLNLIHKQILQITNIEG